MPSYKQNNKIKIYRKVHEIREDFLSLSGTVYGYQDHQLCFCKDASYMNKCVPIQLCSDCDINRSGECPEMPTQNIPGVS